MMDVEEPERSALTVLRKQTASGEAEQAVVGIAMEEQRSLPPLPPLPLPHPLFLPPAHTCAAVRVPAGNWRPQQQGLTLPLPESECPEPRLMKAN